MGILCLRDACPQYGARMTVTFQKKMLVGRASKLDGDGEGSSMRQLQVRFQGSRWSSKWDWMVGAPSGRVFRKHNR